MNPVSDLIEQARAQSREIGYRQGFNDLLDAINELAELPSTDGATLALLLGRMNDMFEIRQMDAFRPSEELAKILNS